MIIENIPFTVTITLHISAHDSMSHTNFIVYPTYFKPLGKVLKKYKLIHI